MAAGIVVMDNPVADGTTGIEGILSPRTIGLVPAITEFDTVGIVLYGGGSARAIVGQNIVINFDSKGVKVCEGAIAVSVADQHTIFLQIAAGVEVIRRDITLDIDGQNTITNFDSISVKVCEGVVAMSVFDQHAVSLQVAADVEGEAVGTGQSGACEHRRDAARREPLDGVVVDVRRIQVAAGVESEANRLV